MTEIEPILKSRFAGLEIVSNPLVPKTAMFRRPWWKRLLWKPWIVEEEKPAMWMIAPGLLRLDGTVDGKKVGMIRSFEELTE